MPGCTGIRAKSCSLWAANSANGANGIMTEPRTGICCNRPLHDGLRRLVQHLNYIYKSEPALVGPGRHLRRIRVDRFSRCRQQRGRVHAEDRASGEIIVFVVNATPVVRYGYRLGVPEAGFYREIINTDAETYGGSNVGNLGGVTATDEPWQGKGHSLRVNLPPLATVALKLRKRKSCFLKRASCSLYFLETQTFLSMKKRSHSAFTLIEMLVVISIAVLAAFAVPALTSALTKGQMTGTMNNGRQLYLAAQQMALDGAANSDPNLVWPGDDTVNLGTLNNYMTRLVQNDYLKAGDVQKLLSGPGASAVVATGRQRRHSDRYDHRN